jgi:ribonuclease HI
MRRTEHQKRISAAMKRHWRKRRLTEQEAFQNYVDANEALIEAKAALEKVVLAKMPGEARVIARKALDRLAAVTP